MNPLRCITIVALASLSLICVVLFPVEYALAGPDKVAFPENYQSGVLYNIADRSDLKEYREMWTSPETIEAAKANRPLPYGTVITHVAHKAVTDAQGVPLLDHK